MARIAGPGGNGGPSDFVTAAGPGNGASVPRATAHGLYRRQGISSGAHGAAGSVSRRDGRGSVPRSGTPAQATTGASGTMDVARQVAPG
ncbi:hypothetical protein GCM10009610_48130 [Pseudonocardia xinjiangensis]